MELNELPEVVETAFEYPVATTTVAETIGARTIKAPTVTKSERLTAVLDRTGVKTYESPEALMTAIRGNLSDEYVGRKYYDDRGTIPADPDDDYGSSDSF